MAQGTQESDTTTRVVLAVDLGLRLGLAAYTEAGELLWYRSQHYATRAKLKAAVYGVMRPIEGLSALVLEGDRGLGSLFARQAQKWGVEVIWVAPETWREALMPGKYRRSGADAKAHADTLARQLIEERGGHRPTSLRHDAAEAILIGRWALLELGWEEEARPPDVVEQGS